MVNGCIGNCYIRGNEDFKMAKKLPVEKLSAKSKKAVPVRIVSDTACSPVSDKGYETRERKYRAEDALRTMQRAAEISSDKTLMKDMQALAKEQMAALSKVAK